MTWIAFIFAVVFSGSALAQTTEPTADLTPNATVALSDTTTVTLRDFILSLLADRDREVAAALASLNARLDSINEFRAQLNDQAKTFATRDQIADLNMRLLAGGQTDDALATRLTVVESAGPPGMVARLNDAITRVDTLSTRLTAIESSGSPTAIQDGHDIQAIASRVTAIEQKGVGLDQAWGIALAVAGLMFGAVATWGYLRTKPQTARN